MKLDRFKIYLFLAVLPFFFTNCNGIKKMRKNMKNVKVTAPSDALEVHGDSIYVDFTIHIPEKFFHKKAILKIEPVAQVGDEEIALPSTYVKGEKVGAEPNCQRILYKKGDSIHYFQKIPYQEKYKKLDLVLVNTYKIDSKYDEIDQCVSSDVEKIAKGCITTSLTVKNKEVPVGKQEEKTPDVKKGGFVYFILDTDRLVTKGSQEGVFDGAKHEFDSLGFKIVGINLVATASMDGNEEHNNELAEKRLKATYDFYVKTLKEDEDNQYVYDSSFIKQTSIAEDWEGFKTEISNSSVDKKSDVLNLVNSSMTPEEKEAGIKELGIWESLKSDVLPKQRRADIKFIARLPIREIFELRKMYDENQMDSMNQKEVLVLAEDAKELEKKAKIYDFYIQKFPKTNWIARNNLAAIYIQLEKPDKAKEILTSLHEQDTDNGYVANNLAILKSWDREYDDAYKTYDIASKKGIDVSKNEAILDIKLARYDDAISKFGAQNDYNTALVRVLNKDYEGAKNVIEAIDKSEMEDAEKADIYYLRAIVGVRTGDIELMTTSLTRAVKLNNEIKERAKTDMEFIRLWDDAKFQNAIR